MVPRKRLYKTVYKNISLKTTDGFTLLGKVNIGDRKRLSDLFTKSGDPFIILVDAKHGDVSAKALFVNKNYIVWVKPDDHPRKSNILADNALVMGNSEEKGKTTPDMVGDCCEDSDTGEAVLNHIRERLEQSEIKEESRTYRSLWRLTAGLFIILVIVVGAMTQIRPNILGMVGLRPVTSQPHSKQVTTEQRLVKKKINRKTKNIAREKTMKVQVPPPSVQTEEKKSTSIHIIQPQETNKRESYLPEEEKKSLKSVITREASKLGVAQAKEKPFPVWTDEDRIISLVESWRKAWERKRLDDYIAHYHPGFKNKGKDLNGWKRYKKKLNERYRSISVKVSDLKVKVEGSKAWAYFIQRFRSDSFRAKGYKLIEFRKEGNSWKIYRERSFAKKPDDWPA